MAIKMLLKPLDLSPPTGRIVRPLLSKLARRVSTH
jgi:hypothetical protein